METVVFRKLVLMERYQYLIYNEQHDLVFKGTANEVKEKFIISSISGYSDKGYHLLGQYTVEKVPIEWIPKNGDQYYYYSTLTESVQKDYWKNSDTNCLLRWNANNAYRTYDLAKKHGSKNMQAIIKRYKEVSECLDY